jgi:hypothetical protein
MTRCNILSPLSSCKIRIIVQHWKSSGRSSVFGIATDYGLDELGIESRWGRDFPHLPRPALGPIQPPVQWVPGFTGGKEWPGRDTDPSPHSSAVVMKEYSYTSTPPRGCTACTEPQCLYKGALYLYLIGHLPILFVLSAILGSARTSGVAATQLSLLSFVLLFHSLYHTSICSE